MVTDKHWRLCCVGSLCCIKQLKWFPKDETMKETWLKLIPGKISKTSVICSEHFKADDFDPYCARKKIKSGAVPSIFPQRANETFPYLSLEAHSAPLSQSRECRHAMTSLSEDKKEWEEEKVLSLIQAYKISPTLWNHNSVEYKNRKLKIRTLHSLAEQFNTTAEEVRRKIHNLRCQFNAELRKIKRKSVEHNIAENLIYSEWKYFDQLNFLAEVYIVRPSRKFNDTASPNQAPIVTKIEVESSESDDDYEEQPASKTPRLNQTDRIFIPNDNSATKATDEDHRIFGEYVASELRNLSDRNGKRLKLMIRKAILEVTEDEYSVETNVKCELDY